MTEGRRTVFVVQHSHPSPGQAFPPSPDDNAKFIGVYSSKESAQRAVERLASKPGFVDGPDGFHIVEYVLDEDHWTAGFVTV